MNFIPCAVMYAPKAIMDECERKIARICFHRPELSPYAVAQALHDYALWNVGSTMRYLELAERCAIAGMSLPWEDGETSELAQMAFLRLLEAQGVRIERADATAVEISYKPDIASPKVKKADARAWVRMNNQPWKRR